MAKGKIEAIEVLGGVIFLAFALVQGEILPSKILGLDLMMDLYTFEGAGDTATITPAMLGSLVILFGTLYQNGMEFSAWYGVDLYLFVATVWLIISPPFVPIIEGVVATGGWGAYVAVAIQSMGYGFVSWVE